MHMARHNAKATRSVEAERVASMLVEALPQSPQNTSCVLETLDESSGCAIFQIAEWALTSFFLLFLLLAGRILAKNPVNVGFGSLKRPHLVPGLSVLGIHGFFLGQELGVFCLQALDGGQFIQPFVIKELLCRLV